MSDSNVDIKVLKELREITAVSLADCKRALVACDGDIKKSIEWLRKQGLDSAAKKADRITAAGVISLATKEQIGVMIELNSETDFVAKNDKFVNLAKILTEAALFFDGSLTAFLESQYRGDKISDIISQHIALVGENIRLSRIAHIHLPENGFIASYVHNAIDNNMGKIGVLLALESNVINDNIIRLGKQLAMHIVATNPASITASQLNPELIQKEKEFFTEQARQAGKTDAMITKMLEGRIRKFQEEVVLLEQYFILDNKNKIYQVLENAAIEFGSKIQISNFIRYTLGESRQFTSI